MRKDYHIHPTVLAAPERMEEFVQRALDKGIEEICITDHMPLPIADAPDRIFPGQVGKYCRAVRELSKRYEEKIRIKCGIEIDFHVSISSEIERVLDEGDFDFILASSHMHVFINDYPRYSFNDFAAAALESSIRAAETGSFHAIAHLDMYRWAFENPRRFPLKNDGYDVLRHTALIDDLIDEVVKQNMYLEINPHLAENKGNIEYTYPEASIVSRAILKGARFSYGSDAHRPSSVGAYLRELEEHPVYGEALKTWEGKA